MIRWIPLFMLCVSLSLYAGEPLTLADFVSSIDAAPELGIHGEMITAFGDASTSTPYINKIEIRTSTNDFDIMKQKYALRFYPKAFGETGRDEALREAMIQSQKTEHESIALTVLKRRITLALEYIETSRKIDVSRDLMTVYADWVEILKKKADAEAGFAVTELIEVEDDAVDLKIDIIKLEEKLARILHSIQVESGCESLALDVAQVVSMARLEADIASVPESLQKNTELKEQEKAIELAQAKYELEEAKGNDYLSFVELAYDTNKWDEPKSSFSLEFAFRLPFINPDRLELNARKSKVFSEKLLYEEKKRQMNEELAAIRSSLKRLIAEHKVLAERKSGGSAETSFQKYLAMDSIPPETLLTLKQSILKSDMRITEVEFLIRSRYFELLELTGTLSPAAARKIFSAEVAP